MEEIWKAIPGEPEYQASNLGRVKRLDRVVTLKTGRKLPYKEKILAGYREHQGYIRITINRKRTFVHTIVLLAFAGQPRLGDQACHNDGNPSNNRSDNLRWGSCAENCNDKRIHGTLNIGKRNGKSKLTDDAVRAIRRDTRKSGVVASEYGICSRNVWMIRSGKIWTHVQ